MPPRDQRAKIAPYVRTFFYVTIKYKYIILSRSEVFLSAGKRSELFVRSSWVKENPSKGTGDIFFYTRNVTGNSYFYNGSFEL